MHQIHVGVARAVAANLECSHRVAELLLELMLRPECQLANFQNADRRRR